MFITFALAFFHFGPQKMLRIGEGDTNFHWAKSCKLHNWRNSPGVGIFNGRTVPNLNLAEF